MSYPSLPNYSTSLERNKYQYHKQNQMKWAPSKGFGCWFLFSSTKAKTTVWPQQEAYSASEGKLGIMQFFFFSF